MCLGVKDVVLDDSYFKKKKISKKEEKAEIKQSCQFLDLRSLLCYLIRLRNLRETLFVEPKCEGVILNVTQLCSKESLFFNMFCRFVSKGLPLRRKHSCISILQSPKAHRRLLKKRPETSQSLPPLHDAFKSVAKQ